MTRHAFGSGRNRASGAFDTPLLYAAGAFLAGMVVPGFEARFFHGLTADASASAVMAVLSVIVYGMLALTGFVFSLGIGAGRSGGSRISSRRPRTGPPVPGS